MIALRVLKPFGLWNAGETAGFHPERAAELVAHGFAERVAPPLAEAPSPAPEQVETVAAEPEADEGEEPAVARRRKA